MPVVLMPVKTRMRVFNPIESDADTGKSGRERNNRCEVYRAARIQAWPVGQIGRFCKRIRSSSAGLRNVEIREELFGEMALRLDKCGMARVSIEV